MAKSNKFGTFGGVFTPSILTILGVIMYMRLPMIVGNAGLYATIGIIVVAHIISVTTGLSVSSIATDKKVEAGGTYYMISRSLGLPIGGTLGLALFVGLSFSVSLYLIGFSESFLSYWGYNVTKDMIRLTGSIILLIVTIITLISTSLALKTQYFIMVAIFLSLISIFFGKHEFTPATPLLTHTTSAIPLMVLFGIFFPAVTGFEAGVSMSGDLKDPKKSIPTGSIFAIVVGFVVYIVLAFFFSYTVDSKSLTQDPKILLKISLVPALVVAGIWGATLSSALGSILGAPRILQATATDRITPKIFSKGAGKTNEPRNALLLTFLIAEAGILIGELNVIARIVSIFFITTYGFLNLSCAFEAMTSADFRPAFKTPAWISLLGSMACIIVMIQLDFVAMLGATLILGALYLYLKRKELALQTGDTWSSIWASLVKSGLKKLKTHNLQSRNWRPNIIMFSGEDKTRHYMVELGKNISGRLGMLSGFELEESNEEMLLKQPVRITDIKATSDFFMKHHTCKDIFIGMDEIIRVYGFSGIEPNTILMGWSRNDKNRAPFINFISRLEKNNFNSVFLSFNPEKGYGKNKTIDIWWSGWGQNLTFAINLIRHLTSSANWKDSEIRLFVVTNDNTLIEIIYKSLENILNQYRVNMDIRVINNSIEKLSKNEIIWRESSQTDLTIVGIPDKKYQQIEKMYDEVSDLVKKLGTTLLINASGTFEEYSVIPEEKISKQKSAVDQTDLLLPETNPSKYSVINDEIEKIDKNGMKVLELFYEKSFIPYFSENIILVKELHSLNESVFSELHKLYDVKEKYRKTKLLLKIRSELYFKAENVLKDFVEEKLATQRDLLLAGIEWYFERLNNDIGKFPKKLTVRFDKIDFAIQKNSSFRLKWFKIRKRVSHPFSKKTIKHNIHFKKIAQYYLKENRFLFLHELLKEFSYSNLLFITEVKEFFASMENQMNIIYNDLLTGSIDEKYIENTGKLCSDKIKQITNSVNADLNLYKNRFLLEFRKNIQLFSNTLEKINSNRLVTGKRKNNKFYNSLKEEIINLPGTWYENTRNYFSKLLLDEILLSFKNRVEDEKEDFFIKFRQQINLGFLKKIALFKTGIQNKQSSEGKLTKAKFELNSDMYVNFIDDFEKLSEEIIETASKLPENIMVSEINTFDKKNSLDDDESIIDVPVRRIVIHFIDSLFIADGKKHLEKAANSIKDSVFRVKDQVSYMFFELENLEPEWENKEPAIHQILTVTIEEITKEENSTREIIEQLETGIDKSLDEAFEPLSSFKITQSSKDISHIIREYQGKQTLGRFDRLMDKSKTFVQNKVVRLLYSQSEGILLAKEITEKSFDTSQTEQILEIIDKVSPNNIVFNSIPTYYKNLFSGRSNIGEDFCIERKTEQTQFEKALNHYKNGYQGGILLLGERNSGKTTFCRHVVKKYFNNEEVYHIFPPLKGSVHAGEFENELKNVTHLSGNANEIIEELPQNSVIVIHDLELWWEMNENGLAVVQLILHLIKNHSHTCLFMVNMNIFTYKRINSILEMDTHFISIITCKPFDSEELKELIMRRHRSGGLKINLGKKTKDQLSEIKLAGLFNKYFNYSGGNPGVALNTWLANVTKFSGELLYIQPPDVPKLDALENINDDLKVVLEQFVLHKRMDMDKLQRVLQINEAEIDKMITFLKMSGLIIEKTIGLYMINTYFDKFLTKFLLQHERI